jgi:hypothetical protein
MKLLLNDYFILNRTTIFSVFLDVRVGQIFGHTITVNLSSGPDGVCFSVTALIILVSSVLTAPQVESMSLVTSSLTKISSLLRPLTRPLVSHLHPPRTSFFFPNQLWNHPHVVIGPVLLICHLLSLFQVLLRRASLLPCMICMRLPTSIMVRRLQTVPIPPPMVPPMQRRLRHRPRPLHLMGRPQPMTRPTTLAVRLPRRLPPLPDRRPLHRLLLFLEHTLCAPV